MFRIFFFFLIQLHNISLLLSSSTSSSWYSLHQNDRHTFAESVREEKIPCRWWLEGSVCTTAAQKHPSMKMIFCLNHNFFLLTLFSSRSFNFWEIIFFFIHLIDDNKKVDGKRILFQCIAQIQLKFLFLKYCEIYSTHIYVWKYKEGENRHDIISERYNNDNWEEEIAHLKSNWKDAWTSQQVSLEFVVPYKIKISIYRTKSRI